MTSANVVEFTIYKDGEEVGRFSKNFMCRLPEFSDLLKYQPLKEHTILAWGYDEEDEYWEDGEYWHDDDEGHEDDGEENLEDFLKKRRRFDKKLKEYFDGKQ